MVSSRAKTDITPIKIEQKGLEKLLRQVNPNKASGPDTIPNRILKECAEPIAPILQIILQQSLDTGDLPKDWRGVLSVVLVKTDLNWSNRSSTFPLLSLIKFAPFFRGAIPPASCRFDFIYFPVTLLHLIFKYQKECKRHLRKAEYEYINQNIFERLKNNNSTCIIL
jgi:hypothetical protein